MLQGQHLEWRLLPVKFCSLICWEIWREQKFTPSFIPKFPLVSTTTIYLEGRRRSSQWGSAGTWVPETSTPTDAEKGQVLGKSIKRVLAEGGFPPKRAKEGWSWPIEVDKTLERLPWCLERLQSASQRPYLSGPYRGDAMQCENSTCQIAQCARAFVLSFTNQPVSCFLPFLLLASWKLAWEIQGDANCNSSLQGHSDAMRCTNHGFVRSGCGSSWRCAARMWNH